MNKNNLKYKLESSQEEEKKTLQKCEKMTTVDLIDRISALRIKNNLSARELSLRIDKNESYINKLEYKKNFEPSISVISDICEACGTTLQEFFYYDMEQFEFDREIIDLLKSTDTEKKQAVICLLKK